MKKMFQSFISFSRYEKMGLIGLFSLIAILLTVRTTMHFWVQQPTIDTLQEKKLVAQWEQYKRSLPAQPDKEGDDYQDAFDESETSLPDIINLNTADSSTLVRLKGIGPKSAHRIMEWRKANGNFTDINQLKQACVIPDPTFQILSRHLTVDTSGVK